MYPCGWVGAFALAFWVAWAAGQEDSAAQSSRAKNNTTKLVSAELHPNAEGNLETRCVVLTFPDVTRQLRVAANHTNTTLTEGSTRTCPPPETPTEIYDLESVFGAPTGAPPPPPNVSFIRERAKNYFVAYNRERRFSKAQVLGMVLVAMMAEQEGTDGGINVLKSQIQLGGLEQEEPPVVVVCLPDGFREERVLKDCIEGETGAMGSIGVASSTHKSQGDAQPNEKREAKTVIDLLKGTVQTTKSPDDKSTRTYLPPVTAPETPAAANPPTAQSSEPISGTKNEPSPRQTAPVIQLSLSGIIRAVLPLSISKMSAELSLSLAPVAQTSFAVPSTAKPNASKPPSFLEPSPKTANPSSTSAMTPTTADSSSPQTSADVTPVHQPETPSAVVSAATSSPVTHSVPIKNISSPPSPPPPIESTPYHSPTTSSAGSPTASSEFSTQPNTTPASSEHLSDTATLSFWVTSD